MLLELAKTGTWSGKKLTKSMINDAAGNFADPVPVIVGHESAFWSDAAPAVGWIEGVEVKGNTLIGNVKLNADGQKLWDGKSFRTWSVGLAKTDDSSPWELAHLALLGATNPAVKGLKVLEFSEGQPKHRMAFINFSESEETEMDPKEIETKLKADFDARMDAEKAEFARIQAEKDAKIAELTAETERAKKAEFASKVNAVFAAADGKVPAEKVNDLKAVFSKENVTVGEILDGINAMFSGLPLMVSPGRMTPAGDVNKNAVLPQIMQGV
jgi:hypothetical protein